MLALAPSAGAQPAWAHQSVAFQNNGAISVKSLSGGAYHGTENPTGALARANQSAVTQPPTVIIQATGATYIQAIPQFGGFGSSTIPSCPSGYAQVFGMSSSGPLPAPILNVGGTRFSLGNHSSGGSVVWYADSAPTSGTSGSGTLALGAVGNSGNWAASLCTK